MRRPVNGWGNRAECHESSTTSTRACSLRCRDAQGRGARRLLRRLLQPARLAGRSISCIERWAGGEGALLPAARRHAARCPQDELREALSLAAAIERHRQSDGAAASRSSSPRSSASNSTLGAPTNEDEAGLRRLAAQLRAGKVVVKLFLRHPLHAKLYLLLPRRPDQPHHRLPRQQQSHLRRACRSRAS